MTGFADKHSGMGTFHNYRFHFGDKRILMLLSYFNLALTGISCGSCLPSFLSPLVITAAVMIGSSVMARCDLYPQNELFALLCPPGYLVPWLDTAVPDRPRLFLVIDSISLEQRKYCT